MARLAAQVLLAAVVALLLLAGRDEAVSCWSSAAPQPWSGWSAA